MQTLFDPRIDTAWKQESLTENSRSGGRAFWGYSAVYRYDLEAVLPRLSQPVLLLNPEEDLWEQTLLAAPLIPNVTLKPMSKVGHGLFQLDRDRIADMIETFLRAE